MLAIFISVVLQRISFSLMETNNEKEDARMGQNNKNRSNDQQSRRSIMKSIKVWSAAGLTTLSAVGASNAADPAVLLT
jgi:hypothetical protein